MPDAKKQQLKTAKIRCFRALLGTLKAKSPTLEQGMENPFTLKVGQVMTGFGIGCGIGIGVGRPLNLGAIPVIDQVMSATRGATVAFSGVGHHMNTFISRLGLKGIEAGVGCGVGFGHGFGAGLAIKPGVVHNIQACLGQGILNIMKKWKIMPDLSSAAKLAVPDSVQNSMRVASETAEKAFQDPVGKSMQLVSQTAEKVSLSPFGNSMQIASQTTVTSQKTLKEAATQAFTANSSGTLIGNPLQSMASQLTNKTGSNEEGERLQSENRILQMLMRHQELLQELEEDNTLFRHVLVEELNVSPDKLQKKSATENNSKNNSTDCFECRRRARRRTK